MRRVRTFEWQRMKAEWCTEKGEKREKRDFNIEDVERGAELSCFVGPLNLNRTDRKVDQILISDRTDGQTDRQTDGHNKHTVGLPCFKKLNSKFLTWASPMLLFFPFPFETIITSDAKSNLNFWIEDRGEVVEEVVSGNCIDWPISSPVKYRKKKKN